MISELGRWFLRWAWESAHIAMLPLQAIKGAWLERGRGTRMVVSSSASQLYFTAIQPLPMFLFIGVTCGFFAIVIADALMRPNGLAPHIPMVVAQSIVRELIPIVIALVLIGRSGTAISTELGYMRVNQEIDALDAAGINIDYFLVLPRIVGVTSATVALTVAMSAAALVGGFLTGNALNLVSVALELEQIIRSLTPSTILLALLKAVMFGVLISTVNCFHGLLVDRSFTEIPQANVRGAVQCYLGCFALNALVSVYALLRSF